MPRFEPSDQSDHTKVSNRSDSLDDRSQKRIEPLGINRTVRMIDHIVCTGWRSNCLVKVRSPSPWSITTSIWHWWKSLVVFIRMGDKVQKKESTSQNYTLSRARKCSKPEAQTRLQRLLSQYKPNIRYIMLMKPVCSIACFPIKHFLVIKNDMEEKQ